ncbi:MAG: hypothetical protein MUF51_06575 [Vicinamibacteria bacterium]|jgi:hypothetical protein|nr:hypothetical protein [Vicinamibacteria bacterium]
MSDRKSAAAFKDVIHIEGGFSLPALKWRELVFIGALKPDGMEWVRDAARPMPPFRDGDLFPVGARFRVAFEGERVAIRALNF